VSIKFIKLASWVYIINGFVAVSRQFLKIDTRHEKSRLPRVKCVVKGFVKAAFACFWRSLMRIKDHLWINLCHQNQRRERPFLLTCERLCFRVKGDPLIHLCALSKVGQKCNQICLRFKSKVCQRYPARSAMARLARTSRSRTSFALRDRLSRFARSTSYTPFSACYTSFVAPHTKDAIISVLLFYVWQVLKNISALIWFSCAKTIDKCSRKSGPERSLHLILRK